ncbi:MAG: hypothetical protein GDA56_03560 [Hormoscilla sp. GM7CHS1pb]|nr:hypothetical protein [Hormoscilla sp. GM7CHS1pb]
MTPTMLRQLWSAIENSQAHLLLKLDDASLVQWLVKQMSRDRQLVEEEADLIGKYIQSRSSLIRDIAQQRLSADFLT